MADDHDNLTLLPTEKLTNFQWAEKGAGLAVMAALEDASKGASRFVGGCVRDSLMGITPHDIDIATQLSPEKVTAAAKAAGLKAVATGLDHGTITVVSDKVGVEVTTLRKDVSTDGRRAVVAFTNDWAEDAARRDFTINALYLTADGKLFDPVGGLDDAKAKSVRFIGDPNARIKEDYLRILRFFRFSARFAQRMDKDGIAACTAQKQGIITLSAERIGDEVVKILALSNAAEAVQSMNDAGVLQMIWPFGADIERLARLKSLSPNFDAALGLAALYGQNDETADGVRLDRTLRLSNQTAKRRQLAIVNASLIAPLIVKGAGFDERSARAALYRIGAHAWDDALHLAAVWEAAADKSVYQCLRDFPDHWTPPVFAIGGEDVLALGVEKGPKIAALLKAVEDQWIAEDFPPEARVREILHKTKK